MNVAAALLPDPTPDDVAVCGACFSVSRYGGGKLVLIDMANTRAHL